MTRIYYHQRARPRSLLLLDKTGHIKKTAPCIGTAKDGHKGIETSVLNDLWKEFYNVFYKRRSEKNFRILITRLFRKL